MAPLSLPRPRKRQCQKHYTLRQSLDQLQADMRLEYGSDGMALQVFQEQRIHLLRYLVGGIVADALNSAVPSAAARPTVSS